MSETIKTSPYHELRQMEDEVRELIICCEIFNREDVAQSIEDAFNTDLKQTKELQDVCFDTFQDEEGQWVIKRKKYKFFDKALLSGFSIPAMPNTTLEDINDMLQQAQEIIEYNPHHWKEVLEENNDLVKQSKEHEEDNKLVKQLKELEEYDKFEKLLKEIKGKLNSAIEKGTEIPEGIIDPDIIIDFDKIKKIIAEITH